MNLIECRELQEWINCSSSKKTLNNNPQSSLVKFKYLLILSVLGDWNKLGGAVLRWAWPRSCSNLSSNLVFWTCAWAQAELGHLTLYRFDAIGLWRTQESKTRKYSRHYTSICSKQAEFQTLTGKRNNANKTPTHLVRAFLNLYTSTTMREKKHKSNSSVFDKLKTAEHTLTRTWP